MTRNGSLGNAPHALAAWLLAADYSAHCRERVVAYATAHGCLAGCPELDPEDEAVATEVYVEALPAVPQTDPEWCDPVEWTLPEAELEAIDAENFAAEMQPGTLADLAQSVAGYLTGLGLEPDVRDGSIRFEFLGRMIQLTLEDIDARLEALAAEGHGQAPWWDDDAEGNRVNVVG
jgi:hypothetical protein